MHACTFLVTFFHSPCLKHTILESYYFFSYFPCILFLILITFCFFSFNFFTFFADLLLCIHGCKIITNSCFAYLNSQFNFFFIFHYWLLISHLPTFYDLIYFTVPQLLSFTIPTLLITPYSLFFTRFTCKLTSYL